MQLSAFAEWGVDQEPSLHGMSEDGSELCQSPGACPFVNIPFSSRRSSKFTRHNVTIGADFIANMKIANYVFNFVFTVECLLKIFGMGFREYIRVAFNKLDFFIVVTSALDMLGEALSEPGEGSGPCAHPHKQPNPSAISCTRKPTMVPRAPFFTCARPIIWLGWVGLGCVGFVHLGHTSASCHFLKDSARRDMLTGPSSSSSVSSAFSACCVWRAFSTAIRT
jgi:hypothetical protein